ncbi:uncharacterized protein LY89DRAFT_782568 [Mollisia scopiformis]|uniref:Uncharacterized protein n=1 Tax=Mollisia scopiformis TaxID=149040 RepID=A0A194X7Z3_MOLSC|nr:uncharacterized protein LY89DRAFT_782568 [Mollisia scopiformis]KUJ16280.1 hypothetical protein LY89DRAFT_782568 [Mollisia scopiformis]
MGFVETLQRETEHLGIQSIISEPGEFRTNVSSSSGKESEFAKDVDYGELARRVQAGLKASNRKQKGDTKKAAKIMVDVVKGEGVEGGKSMPKRLPLGRDCLETVRRKETLELCDEWEEIVENTESEKDDRVG